MRNCVIIAVENPRDSYCRCVWSLVKHPIQIPCNVEVDTKTDKKRTSEPRLMIRPRRSSLSRTSARRSQKADPAKLWLTLLAYKHQPCHNTTCHCAIHRKTVNRRDELFASTALVLLKTVCFNDGMNNGSEVEPQKRIAVLPTREEGLQGCSSCVKIYVSSHTKDRPYWSGSISRAYERIR